MLRLFKSSYPPPRSLQALMIVLTVTIALAGTFYYRTQYDRMLTAAQDQVATIARLKAQDLEQWLQRQRTKAASLYYSRLGVSLREFIHNPEIRVNGGDLMLEWLVSLARSYNFQSLTLLDPEGRILLSFPGDPVPLDDLTRREVSRTLATREVQSSQRLWSANPQVQFAVPLLTEQGRAGDPIGVLVVRAEARTFLRQLLSSWPSAATSAMTVLLNPDGQALPLLKVKPGPVPSLVMEILDRQAQPLLAGLLEDLGNPARQASPDDAPGSADETDAPQPPRMPGLTGTGEVFSNTPMVFSLQPVEASPWYLGAGIERREILADVPRLKRETLFMITMLVLMATLGPWGFWQRYARTAVQREMKEQRAYEQKLKRQANYDALTGLANRNLLYERLEHAIPQVLRRNRTLAVLFLDLDRFKPINDSLGHGVGDQILKLIAARLETSVRAGDTVARLGGDEFVIVLEELTHSEDAGRVARQILDAIAPPFQVEGYDLHLSGSIGISVLPRDGRDRHTLLKHADIAMYHAKHQGRNTFSFYEAAMNTRSLERLVLENDLRRSLGRQELILHYQPQVRLDSGRPIGLEALLRWRHHRRGMVPPGEFIPLAEETGLIVPIGEWVIGQVCRQISLWHRMGLPPLQVGINLSPRQFMYPGLALQIQKHLTAYGLRGECLELEITESLLMQDVEQAIRTLDDLKAQGIALAIDDFGTGYSSLAYLKRFPLDRLKIDQSFVRDITTDPNDAAITRSVVALSHSLGLRVIAEGVETYEQMDFLRREHCDEIQGYYLSRPLPGADMTLWLQQGHLWTPEAGNV